MGFYNKYINKLNESIDVRSFELRENSPATKVICDMLNCTPDDIRTGIGFIFNDWEPEDYVLEMMDGTGRLINTNKNTIKEFKTPQDAQKELFSDGANYIW